MTVAFKPSAGPRNEQIALASLSIPDFGSVDALPLIPEEAYSARADALVSRAAKDWVVVYADREHVANMLHLTGFEPRFEEALLVLGRSGERYMLVGNESIDYLSVARLPRLQPKLAQSLSLMAQDRSVAPLLKAVLAECGLSAGQSVGLVGWKYLEAEEWNGTGTGYVFPHHIVRMLAEIAGDDALLHDVTPVLMHPETGERAVVDADQIAVFEWAAVRASQAVWRAVSGAKPGMSEFEIAGSMGYQGEPLSCHTMMASAAPGGHVIGLRGPTARRIASGDGVTTAVGYWGALSSRAGLLSEPTDGKFLDQAKTYFAALITWYRTAGIGVEGGLIHSAVTERLAEGGLKPALNPGHLLSYDEWSHSPVRPGSREKIRSGMAFQVDVIPGPVAAGAALNSEDAIVFADENLRSELASRHPKVAARIAARRRFIKDTLGIELKDEILPLSNTPLCLPPFWLAADHIFHLEA
jgi:hypothetical protein